MTLVVVTMMGFNRNDDNDEDDENIDGGPAPPHDANDGDNGGGQEDHSQRLATINFC